MEEEEKDGKEELDMAFEVRTRWDSWERSLSPGRVRIWEEIPSGVLVTSFSDMSEKQR